MRTLFYFFFLIGVLTGCEAPDLLDLLSPETAEEDAIIAVIYENMDAYFEEDIDRFMETIDPESPYYGSTRAGTLQLFQNYEVDIVLKDVYVISIDGGFARVHFVQVTKKVSGMAFRDNRVEGVHVLRKTADGWKIYSSELTDVEYLDEAGNT